MAINYLNNVDLNRNELQNAQLIKAQVENQPNNTAAGTGLEGQLYYDTTLDVLKVWSNGSWSSVGGGVESIDLLPSTYVSLVDTGTAAIPELTASLSAIDGTAVAATRFLSKDNTWDVVAFPASDNYGGWTLDADGNGTPAYITSGMTADFVGGLKITTDSDSFGTLNIKHDLQTQTDTTTTVSPAYGASFTVVDSVTRDTTGHATGLNVKTVTLPAPPSDATITLTGGTGLADLGGSFGLNQASNQTITFNVGAGAGILSNANDVAIKYSGTGNIIDAAADGTVIATADKILYEDATDSIVKEIAVSSLASLINTTYTLPTSAGTAVTGYTVADINLTPGGALGGGGRVTIAGKDSNIAITETIGTNGIVKIALTDDVTIGDTLTVQQDVQVNNDLNVVGGGSFGGNVGVSGDLTVESDAFFNGSNFEISPSTAIDFGANKITNVADPTASDDAATKNYVDSSNAGQLIYQGGYNASTNVPNLDTATNIAIKRGFTYTVTVDGLFFTEQVRVGDLLVANVDIPANSGTNALGNWTTVQNNIDLASEASIGIGNVVPGASNTITAPYTNGTATLDVVNSTALQKGAVIVAGTNPISVAYAAGKATVSIANSAATQKGAVIVSGGTGVAVSYSAGTATVASTLAGINVPLNELATGVTRTVASGVTTFAVNTSTILNTVARNVKAEVIADVSGATVYPSIYRGTGVEVGVMYVEFTGTVANAVYSVLLQPVRVAAGFPG